jgi:hypothetical protein
MNLTPIDVGVPAPLRTLLVPILMAGAFDAAVHVVHMRASRSPSSPPEPAGRAAPAVSFSSPPNSLSSSARAASNASR